MMARSFAGMTALPREQASQKMRPHIRQWCRLVKKPKATLQRWHSVTALSLTQVYTGGDESIKE